MAHIKLLSEDMVNKIAAGEVIERPASVVKELMENSFDAGSTNIRVSLVDGGMGAIIIQDDGHGMEPADAQMSVQRHATSKIASEADLFAIRTLGFRGEALSSIASVSRLTICTKREQDLEGLQLSIEGGKIVSQSVVGCTKGTRMEVRDLFYNVPARKKYVKSEQTELSAVLDILSRYALIHPSCALHVEHNGRTLFQTTGDGNVFNVIVSLYGTDVARDMIPLDVSSGDIRLRGYVSRPVRTRSDRSDQSLFINGRYIKNRVINSAIDKAYHTLVMHGRHPIVFLDMHVDFGKIDVNVHPAKIEVRIAQEKELHDLIETSVRDVLLGKDLSIPVREHTSRSGTSSKKYKIEKSVQQVLEPAKPIASYRSSSHISKTGYGKEMLQKASTAEAESKPVLDLSPEFRVLGQVHKTFIIAEIDGGLCIIDQHVAHERVLYEEYKKKITSGKLESQTLLDPERLVLPLKEKALLREHIPMFYDLGFDIEEFGDEFLVRTVPLLVGKVQSVDIIKDMLYGITHKIDPHENTPIDDTIDSMAARMSCRSAVKAGHELTSPEIHRILGQLLNTKNPYSCPHGRPIIMKMSLYDLEKMFKRKE